jgi:predicted ATPase/Flp pilus assembly protein TadD
MEDPTVEPPVITPPIEEPVVVSIGPGVGVPKSNVPKRLDAFFGRGDELAELARLLADGKQLITVLGAGGTGKTRLSQRFISDHLDRFPGGAWFCDLSEGGSRAGILSAVGAALNVPLTGRDPDTQLAHAIAGRGRILVILDNFEQVVEHAADTIGRWLQTAPEAVFVVTSRVVLKIDGEVVFHLDPLPVDEAMALFYDRAAAVDPRFTRSAENEAAVREIVERVDGMALAVELAAARVRMLTPLQIRERLSQRFKLLRGTRRDRPARQTTLRGTIDWSWTLLSPAEQATLTQLSVFRGGWTLEAAEAVVDLDALDDAPWVMDTLEMLVDHSLVRRRETHVGRARYHMLASIRDYAEEKLGERADVAARHAAHFARWGAQDALDALDTFGGVAHWRAMAVELDNLVAATRSGLALGRLGAAGPSARAAGMILRTRGSFAAGESFLREVLETQGMETQETAPHLWSLLGDVCRMLGRPADAGVHYDTGLAIHREAGDRRGEAVVLNSLGTLHSEQGRMGEARAHYGAALAIHREDGNRLLEGFVLDDLGVVHKEQGRLEAAREHYESALAIHREVGNQPGEASALCRLGILHMEQGRMEEARQHYEYALTICRELGNGPGEGRILSYLGGIHSVEGRMDQARRHFERALVIHRECGDRGSQGIDLGNLGDLAYGEGDLPSAAHHLEQAIGICDEVIPAAAGAFRGSLSLICGRQGDITKARELLAKGEAALRDVNALELAKLLCKRAKIEHLAGDPAESEGAIAEAESIARQLDAGPDSELGQVLADARAVMA